MVERRPVWALESTPPTTPPTYDYLQEQRDKTDPTDGTEDTPLGVTMGDAFPANPQAYHRHYLTKGVIDGTEEWFFFDPTRAGGTGRWVSEALVTFRFTSSGGVTNGSLTFPGAGASGANVGYWGQGRPMVLFRNAASQGASGGDGGMKLELRSSSSGLGVVDVALGTNLVKQQGKRDIYIPSLSGAELFYCYANGTTGTQVVVEWALRRTEVNP